MLLLPFLIRNMFEYRRDLLIYQETVIAAMMTQFNRTLDCILGYCFSDLMSS